MLVEYFEDVELHNIHRALEYPLSEKEIIDFARQWNPRPMHLDSSAAARTGMGGLFAAGAHLIAICARILPGMEPATAIVAGLAMDKIRFVNAGRPGDVLRFEIEAIEKRESKSRPNAGIVTFVNRLFNQRGELVLKFESTSLVEKRPKR